MPEKQQKESPLEEKEVSEKLKEAKAAIVLIVHEDRKSEVLFLEEESPLSGVDIRRAKKELRKKLKRRVARASMPSSFGTEEKDTDFRKNRALLEKEE